MSYVKSAMFFLGLSLFVLGANAKAADYIVPCHIKDTDDCYLASAKKALPHIAALADPLKMDDVNCDVGDLVFRLTHLVLKGLTNCNILKLVRQDRLKASLVLECPVVVTGHYILGGNLLGLPVQGNSTVEIKTANIRISLTIELKSYKGKDNEDHYKIVKFDYEFEPVAQVFYNFKDLFNGDAEQAKPIEQLLNELVPGKEVLRSVGKPVVEEVATKVVVHVNSFFHENPSKDIELP